MSSAVLLVHGAHKVDAAGEQDDFWLASEHGLITAVGRGGDWRPFAAPGTEVIDAGGAALTPGLIDLHCHGGGGHSYEDGAAEIRAGLALHRAHGTTRSLISLVSAPIAGQQERLASIAALAAEDPLVLGAHLEGPYLAPGRRGAHDPDALRAPTEESVAAQLEAAEGTLRMVTLAPELPGAAAAQQRFQDAGAVVAIGHTDADHDLAAEAFARGARALTHAFNAMAPIGHRAPGPVIAAAAAEHVVLEVILDGVHVHPEVVAALFRMAPERIALITDAMAAAGCADGPYTLGALPVEVSEGVAMLAGTGTLAGSTLTQDAALRHALAGGLLDAPTAIRALTLTPARLLDRHDLGLLEVGYRADAVLWDGGWRVRRVIAEGAVQPA